jgi:hypothetical protein
VQSIANDIGAVYPNRRASQHYLNDKNGFYSQKTVRSMDASDLLDDESLISRPYIAWEDATIGGDPRFEAIWVKLGGRWYLRSDVFTSPQTYDLSFKELSAYIFSIIDQGYRKKKVPSWKKAVAFIIFIIIVVVATVTGQGWAIPLAQGILLAATVLVVLSLLASALGAEDWASAFAHANKELDLLITVATLYLIFVTGGINPADLSTEAGREAAKQVAIEYVENFAQNMVDGIIQGATDVLAGNFTTNAALAFINKSIELASTPMKNKIKELGRKNVDLKAEYEQMKQEMSREYDVLQGFANIYAQPATADWSIYAEIFDLPYERGGGPMSLGNIQRTTKQALRKGDYDDPAFEGILVI